MLQGITAAMQTALWQGPLSKHRIYIDFRNIEYPAITDTLTYSDVDPADNRPGTKYASGGYASYLLPLTSKFTLDIHLRANFAFDVGSNQALHDWYGGDPPYNFRIWYDSGDDTLTIHWEQSAVQSVLKSSAFNGTTLPLLRRMTVVVDSTTGSTAGSALYINGIEHDVVWSGAISPLAREVPLMQLRAVLGGAGLWDISQVRLFLNKLATAAEVANNFQDLREEEIVFSMQGASLGRTRCNVSRYVLGRSSHRETHDLQTAEMKASRLTLLLKSIDGEFADDQYAAFDPTVAQFNGLTAATAYMKHRPGVIDEVWYGTEWEPFFTGRTEGGFHRESGVKQYSKVQVQAADLVAELANRKLRRGRYYEDYKLASATEAESLVHTIARLGSQREVYNYAANSSFENATITNSWVIDVGASWARVAGGLLGSFAGRLNATSVHQYVNFFIGGSKYLNFGETWTFSLWVKPAASISGTAATIELWECNAAHVRQGDSGSANLAPSPANSWTMYECDVTIQLQTSASLELYIRIDAAVDVYVDCTMLVQASRAPKGFVLIVTDGISGGFSADNAASDSYDLCGFAVDPVTIVHPWARVEIGDNPWAHLKDLGDACLSYRIGMDESGVFVFKAILGDAFTDPAALETIKIPQYLVTDLAPQRANKIIVRGDYIRKENARQLMWLASECSAFQTQNTGKLEQAVLDTAQFPDPDTYGGEFVALYGNGPKMD